jgi:energy-converting hydrogenase Eha subunit H
MDDIFDRPTAMEHVRLSRRSVIVGASLGALGLVVAPTLLAASPAGAASPGQWGGHANGRIPASAMKAVPAVRGGYLRADAADAYTGLNAEFRARFGKSLTIQEGYRDYARQVYLYDQYQNHGGNLAAPPGTSIHGWALACDFGAGVNSYGTPEKTWVNANGPRFGWKPTGDSFSSREPWHFDFFSSAPNNPSASTPVLEAASNNAWKTLPMGINGQSVAAIVVSGVKFVYTVRDGYVFEAASNNKWINLNTGIPAQGVAALSLGGVKFVYSINNGQVYESASNNAWKTLPMGIAGQDVAAIVVNGVKFVYTVNGGYVWEAASNNRWINLNSAIPAQGVAAIALGGSKYVYSINNGQVYESASNNAWRTLPMGIAGQDVAATVMNGIKYVYTARDGYIFEAASNNQWINLNSGIPGVGVAAITLGSVKIVYAR